MRLFYLIILLLVPTTVMADRLGYNSNHYYKLLNKPPTSGLPSLTQEQQLRRFYQAAWPERGNQGYISTRYVRSAAERKAFIEALARVIRERLHGAGQARPGSRAYHRATMSSYWNKRQPEPMAHRTLLLSLDGDLSEDDIWQVASLRIKSGATLQAFEDLAFLFPPSDTTWTPEATAVFDLLRKKPTSALGIQQLLHRYVLETKPRDPAYFSNYPSRVALPIHGLYTTEVEDLLALLEGYHLWRARGHSDLARAARRDIKQRGAALSGQLGQPLDDDIAGALNASANYARVFWHLRPGTYWPTGSEAAEVDRSQDTPPASPRWIRIDTDSPLPADEQVVVTRRVGSTDPRWWPAFQEAYIDLAYRQLPRLLRQQLAAPGKLEVFRVWHAGAEDGSQTFLLAALLDIAVDLLLLAPESAEFKHELQDLRLEIIASDYTYMPDREGRIYRFDVSDQIGDLHHKWNLLPDEFAYGTTDSPSPRFPTDKIQTQLTGTEDTAQHVAQLRSLADRGLVAALLDSFFALAAAVDAPSGAWRRHYSALPAKHRYRLKDTPWRVVELRDGQTPLVVSPGSKKRLIRFEKGDMTRQLPRGFEAGNAFDFSVVTSVLPYIYGYYRNVSQAAPLPEGSDGDVAATPMEMAQNNLALGARPGAWILVDPATEREALASGEILATGESWALLWRDWLNGPLAGRQVELLVTDSSGIRATQKLPPGPEH